MSDGRERRDPLSSRSLNHSLNSPSPPTSLYPIFLGKRVASSNSTTGCPDSESKTKRGSSSPAVDSRRHENKRPRLSLADGKEGDNTTRVDGRGAIQDYFSPSLVRRGSLVIKPAPSQPPEPEVVEEPIAWRRPRARLGFPSTSRRPPHASHRPSYLSSLVFPSPSPSTRSLIALPSFRSPSGYDRDFDPALVVVFNNRAKLYSADEARQLGEKRLLALGSEEGAVKLVNVDASESEDAGTWWRAHNNAVFDLKWTANDTRLVTASADQNLRIHDVSTSEPRALATLLGHTSTIKAVTFLDPLRGSGSGAAADNIVASGGRDGNINIYDLRCPGTSLVDTDASSSLRRSSRTRLSGTLTQELSPVLTLRQPHNNAPTRRGTDLRSVSRTITSLGALQSMPGILASGGTYDGIVKLWDIRCPEPTSNLRPKSTLYGVLPDPTTFGPSASVRGRSVNALCEQPTNGDLYALCGDSKIHVLRPSAAKHASPDLADAILPQRFVHPNLVIKSFYIRMSLSPDGQYLACGSRDGGVLTWDTEAARSGSASELVGTRLEIPNVGPGMDMPEVAGVDWAKDMLAACSDDSATRLWRASSA